MSSAFVPERNVIRTILTATMAGHGLQKLIPTDRWPGPARAGELLAGEGLRGGTATAAIAGVTQVAAATLTAARPRSAMGPALALGSMVVATAVKAPNGAWSHQDGVEYPVVLAALAAATAVAAPPSRANRLLLAAGSIGGGVAAVVLRDRTEVAA